MVRQGGNIAVRLFSTSAFPRQHIEALEARVQERLGGRIDGELDDRALVFTIPADTAFGDIQALFDPFVRDATIPGAEVEWEYGNIHADTGAAP